MHRVSLLYRMNGIHDWSLDRTSAWLNVFRKRVKGPILLFRHDEQRVKEIIADAAAGKD